ncbi:hypothetical protein LTR70_010644 [Exophiala xenobiotica]|uniref:Enoyl reductase (ER) domain-containing protein n=1 Tax=Lithohypha guttulata TaxID=1690604 RepID=A0ABR0JVM3_9EURO|nr:hypothetical protein LTR24_010168 [Lithohypha guttulata]KAK5309054.1 hypothetical protein LTR70_010644 [Exophiala xenobiotica]
MPTNTAAWILSSREQVTVKDAPYTPAGPDEVVIENSAVAINPLDWKLQSFDPIPTFPVKYPMILGSDVAGTIIEVGNNVHARKVGERVIAHCVGFAVGRPEASGYQKFSITPEAYAVPIPDHVNFEAGAVLPLSCDSAMAGLFLEDHLGLKLPAADANRKDEALVVWGGSSSVGCSVIQMASAAGYDVFVMASKRNHELCSSLGSVRNFDYADSDVVDQVVEALQGKTVVGAYDCVGDHEKTLKPCTEILVNSAGKKLVVTLLEPPGDVSANGVRTIRTNIRGTLSNPEVLIAVHSWMAEALAQNRLQPKPDPTVIGHGLEYVQIGLDRLKEGVSAAKIVVTL